MILQIWNSGVECMRCGNSLDVGECGYMITWFWLVHSQLRLGQGVSGLVVRVPDSYNFQVAVRFSLRAICKQP